MWNCNASADDRKKPPRRFNTDSVTGSPEPDGIDEELQLLIQGCEQKPFLWGFYPVFAKPEPSFVMLVYLNKKYITNPICFKQPNRKRCPV